MTQRSLYQLFLATSFSVFLFLAATPLAHSETDSRPLDSSIGLVPQDAQSPTAGRDEEFQERLTEHRASLTKKTQERAYHLLQNVTGRMNAVVYRFTNIADRIEVRRELLARTGRDTTEASQHLQKARDALVNATRILDSDLGAFATAENPRERFVNVRANILEVGALLRDTQSELRTALTGLASVTSEQNEAPVSP